IPNPAWQGGVFVCEGAGNSCSTSTLTTEISDRGALGGVTSWRASAIDPAPALRRVRYPIVLMYPSLASPSIPTLTAHGAEATAWKYGTERGVGEGIRASGVRRDEIFLTTKVSHEYLRAGDFARSVDQSLKTLGVDFVDLLLVHWPNPEIPLS